MKNFFAKKIAFSFICFCICAGSVSAEVPEEELPGDAEAGDCYAKIEQPATYKTVKRRVLVKAASSRVETKEPVYKSVKRSVVVKEASKRVEVIPAKFETKRVKVKVQEESSRIVKVPAKYKTITKKLLVEPAKVVWEKGRGTVERVAEDGEIYCRVEKPAVYKTVKERVLAKPASTKEIKIPAKFKVVEKEVLVSEAETKTIFEPEVRKTVQVKKLVKPAEKVVIKIPAKYKTVKRKVVDEPAHLAWEPVVCQTNATKELITKVQEALKKEGLDPGELDGVLGAETQTAIEEFQEREDLSVGYLTEATLQALDINI